MEGNLRKHRKGWVLGLWGDNYVDHGPYSEFGDLLTHRLSQFVGAGYGIPLPLFGLARLLFYPFVAVLTIAVMFLTPRRRVAPRTRGVN